MRISAIVPALAAAALLTFPATASAQQYPNPNWGPNPNWSPNGNASQRRRDGDDRRDRDDRRDNDDRRDHRDRDDRNGNDNGDYNGNYNNGYGRYGNNGYGRYGNNGYGRYGNNSNQINGTVTAFSSFSLQLNNSPHINLHQGTVINPTGTTLQPGMQVQVFGHPNSDGSYEADQINVVGNNYGNYGGPYNGGVVSPSTIGNILGRFGF